MSAQIAKMNSIMIPTKLLYFDDTYKTAILCKVQGIGNDDKGNFLIFDQTIFYPGGGGQPKDVGFVGFQGNTYKIINAEMNNGFIKHFLDRKNVDISIGDTIALSICRQTRILHSIFHTAGHWVASAVTEGLKLPFLPLKGYHYPEGAYIEFEGDKTMIRDSILENLQNVINTDAQADLKIFSEIILPDERDKLEQYLNQINLQSFLDKPVRIVRIGNYKSVPCGGTHIHSVREIKSIQVTKIFAKNGKIRISYNCTPWEMPVS